MCMRVLRFQDAVLCRSGDHLVVNLSGYLVVTLPLPIKHNDNNSQFNIFMVICDNLLAYDLKYLLGSVNDIHYFY